MGSFVVADKLFVVACGIPYPDQDRTLGPLHWEHRVLAIGPPGKPLSLAGLRLRELISVFCTAAQGSQQD